MIPLQRRREQTRLAQRAFRQRQEDTVRSLADQVEQLQHTIKGLNDAFLSLTNVLSASQWLKKDASVAVELRNTIQTFLELTQIREGSNSKRERFASEPNLNQQLDSVDSLKQYNMGERTTSHLTPDSSMFTLPTVETTEITETTNRANDVANDHVCNESSPYFGILPPFFKFSVIQSMSWQPLPVNGVTFAKRLHQAACQEGYRILCNMEHNAYDYQQIYGYMLQTHTKESLFWYHTKALNENMEEALSPPEAVYPFINIEIESSQWLNATEVYHHFRMKGIDLNESPMFAEFNIDKNAIATNVTEKQNSLPMSMLRSITSYKSTRLSNPYPEIESYAGYDPKDLLAPSTDHSKSKLLIDVAKLINGMYLFVIF